MKWDTLQLMFYGKDIQAADVSVNSDKIFISKKYKTQNSDYIFLDIVIPEDANPGAPPPPSFLSSYLPFTIPKCHAWATKTLLNSLS